MTPKETYNEHLKRCELEVQACEAGEGKFGVIRLILFSAIVVILYVKGITTDSLSYLAICVIAFLAMMHFHDKLKRRKAQATRAVNFYKWGLARIDDNWVGKGQGADPDPDTEHLFADDLDLFGTGSLFELLNTCRTHLGRESLARLMRVTVDQEEIKDRQEAVKELCLNETLREDRARLEGKLGESKFEAFEGWANLPTLFFKKHVNIASFLAVLAVVALYFLFVPPFPLCKLFILVVIFVQYLFSRKLKAASEQLTAPLDRFHKQLKLLVALLSLYENEKFNSKKLNTLQSELKVETTVASEQFKKLDFWVEFMNHCLRNQFVMLFAMVFQLNVFILYAIDKWRRDNANRVIVWLKSMGELEALTSIGAYAFENPNNAYATIKAKEDLCYEAIELGHPLLPKAICVSNDVSMNQQIRLLIVSGSNMAGKSTFLRTIGVNAVLAYIGAPVRAKQLTLSPLSLGMTLKIQDSLQDGQSRFYSEIDRIRRIKDLMAEGPYPVMFVLDELLSGTNSHERLLGSEALLRQFLKKKTLGLVTTHDLALTDLGGALDEAKNIYLSEKWTDGKPDFEYKVYEGVQKQGNALQWMRALGLDV